jgi:hypothetical protein
VGRRRKLTVKGRFRLRKLRSILHDSCGGAVHEAHTQMLKRA